MNNEGSGSEPTNRELMTNQEETLVRHLIAMIQADGVINPEETGLLAQVLGRLDLEPEEIAQAGRWLSEPQTVSVEDLQNAFSDRKERQVVAGVLLEIARSDSSVGHQEVRLLNTMATALS